MGIDWRGCWGEVGGGIRPWYREWGLKGERSERGDPKQILSIISFICLFSIFLSLHLRAKTPLF